MKQRKNETVEEFRAREAEYKRQRRAEKGEDLNARERELYAEKKGEPVRQYRKGNTNENRMKEKRLKTKGEAQFAFSCDFETTTHTNNEVAEDGLHIVRVWEWCATAVKKKGTHTENDFFRGTTIESFFEWVYNRPTTKFYFHNVKFDGSYILDHLLGVQGAIVFDGKEPNKNEHGNLAVKTLIADTGQWYRITIYKLNGEKYDVFEFEDSLKLLNASVANIAKDFECTAPKGDCDYHKVRPIGYEPTEEEFEYCRIDTLIIAEALYELFSLGILKMTIASSALDVCTQILNKKEGSKAFEKFFPQLELHEDTFVRHSYRGGFTFCNPYFQDMDIHRNGIVLDVNSMYPAVMEYKPLPYGRPKPFIGQYDPATMGSYDFYFVRVEIKHFKLKRGGVPFIQVKAGRNSKGATYTAEEFNYEGTFSCVDLELLFENYDVEGIDYLDGMAFRSRVGLLWDYLETYAEIKRTEKGAKRSVAKLLLNSIYGKFGSSPKKDAKVPYWNEEKKLVSYKTVRNDPDAKNTIYVPYASAVTSWARRILLDAIRAFGMESFAYCDTDSVHAFGDFTDEDLKNLGIPVDEAQFGCWKIEGRFDRARYIHTKCYLERIVWTDKKGYLDKSFLTGGVAGCPKSLQSQINFDNFETGLILHGKLQHKTVHGGALLVETDFQIKPTPPAVNNYPFADRYNPN